MSRIVSNSNQRRTPHQPNAKYGFALVIAILLMAFLVLMMISVTALTQMGTQLSSQKKQSLMARQNALLALNIALGQLQKYAGPDQRTTARADLDANPTGSITANASWLGVYGSGAPIDYNREPSFIARDITDHSNSKGSQAMLLNWLVSGNENTSFDAVTDIAADGSIVQAPDSFQVTPTMFDPSLASTIPKSNDDLVLLVGEYSAASREDYVAAPLVSIDSPTTGRYAWWIGDEGAKANVTLGMASNDQLKEAFVSAQRTAIELADRTKTNSFDINLLIGDNFDFNASELSNISSLDELSFIAINSPDEMVDAVQENFHDLTPHSQSLLIDSYAGGLKQDLSAALATGATSPADTDYIFTPDDGPLTDDFAVPTWGALRSFAQTTSPQTDGLEPRSPSTTDVGVAPVLTYFALGFRYVAPEGRFEGAPIRLALFPLVVLWNPYTTTINAHEYEVGYQHRFRAILELQVEDENGNWQHKEAVNFNEGAGLHNTLPDYGYVRFRINSPDIPPGASLIFTLQGDQSGAFYDASHSGEPNNVMTNGLNAASHVLLDFGANTARFEAGEENRNFRASGAEMTASYSWATPSLSGRESAVYLGEVNSQGPIGHATSAANDKQWHQSISRFTPARDGPDNLTNGRNTFLQAPGPLEDFVNQPSAVMYVERNFAAAPTASPDYPDVRWIAQSNPRALYTMRSYEDRNPPNISAGLGMQSAWQTFNAEINGLRASAGTSLDSTNGPVDATLFEFRPHDLPLLSLGQLQHANLSYMSTYPAYPIGNSLGDYHFKDSLDQVHLPQTPENGVDISPTDQVTSYYDLSWLLNRALWDRYFVSTVPHAGTGTATDTNNSTIPDQLPNPRIARNGTLTDAELRDAKLAASDLTLQGGFNINSTSEQAWRAVLGGVNQLPYDPESGNASGVRLEAALPRFSKPIDAPEVDATQAWAWQGYRQLTEEQIAELAKNIVVEVRNRGPFVSMGDFVNRRLVDNPATPTDERFKGALQAAIDATFTGSAAINNGTDNAYGASGSNPFYLDSLPNYRGDKFDLDLMKGYTGALANNIPYGSTSAFAPQFLTQADVLSTIGAGLTARSDTFVIRAYGEALNPFTQESESRTWCEAIVQRQIDYLEDTANDPQDALGALSGENRVFGRKFKIVSFRWLSPEEI